MLANMDNNDLTVATSNRSNNHEVVKKAARPTQISKELVIADAGATGHFPQPGAPEINIRRTKKPISISQPDGGIWNPHTNVR